MNIDELAHKITMFAMEQKDNVNMYSAVKNMVVEWLTEEMNILLNGVINQK